MLLLAPNLNGQISVTASRSKSAVIGKPRFSNAAMSSSAGRAGLVQRARIFLMRSERWYFLQLQRVHQELIGVLHFNVIRCAAQRLENLWC